ncbi:MAG: Hpt domain-containing protein, partial [Xanthomonadales bacterium]|nr:Hpt domain-containing protein [Xanthomonadales bacterium]
QFFRAPTDAAPLGVVPGLMAQMRGVLSVLGLEQATLAVSRMRERVEGFRERLSQGGEAPTSDEFETLGSSLGALGFLIDTLSYQPLLARQLFYYDEEREEFRFVTGRVGAVRQSEAVDALDIELETEAADAGVPSVAASLQAVSEADGSAVSELEQLAAHAALDERPALAEAASRAADAARQNDEEQLTSALQDLQAAAAEVVPTPPPSATVAATPEAGSESEEDDELLGIFLEEAREVLTTARGALVVLAETPSDMEALTTVRRGFHTLKGSSRRVGLMAFGSAAWSLEQLLNAWLAEQKPADSNLCGVAAEALGALECWVDDISRRDADDWKAEPFERLADALRLRGERMVAALRPGTTVSLATVPADAPALVPAAEPLLDLSLEQPAEREPSAFAPVAPAPGSSADLQLPKTLELDQAAPFEVEAVELGDDFVDLMEIELETDALAVPAPASSSRLAKLEPSNLAPLTGASGLAPLSPSVEVEQALDAIDLPLEPASSDTPAASAVRPSAFAPLQPTAFPELGLPDEAAPAVRRAEVTEATQTESNAQGEQVLVDAAPAPAVEDAVRVIDGLRISTPLYNVYLSEADTWSEQLVTDLADWAANLDSPVPERAIARAHSLAGSSATVGFTALSGLAHAVEHALERLQGQSQGTTDQARVLCDAADDIRRVLHQFAAGMLKTPAPDVLAAVQALEPVLVASLVAPDSPAGASVEHAPMIEAEPVIEAELVTEAAPVAEAPAPSTGVWPFASTVPSTSRRLPRLGAAAPVVDVEEEIEALDAVDPDLFPIFEEEAEELLPRLSASLRQWAERPDDLESRAEALRALHTLKGSARLAGALRLGEMAHRTESEIEVIGTENLASGDLEPLLEGLDRIQAGFQELRRRSITATQAIETAVLGAAALEDLASTEPVLAVPTAPDALATPDAPPSLPVVERGEVALPTALSLAGARVNARQTVR